MEGGANSVLFKSYRRTLPLDDSAADNNQQGFNVTPFHVAVDRIGEDGLESFSIFAVHACCAIRICKHCQQQCQVFPSQPRHLIGAPDVIDKGITSEIIKSTANRIRREAGLRGGGNSMDIMRAIRIQPALSCPYLSFWPNNRRRSGKRSGLHR